MSTALFALGPGCYDGLDDADLASAATATEGGSATEGSGASSAAGDNTQGESGESGNGEPEIPTVVIPLGGPTVLTFGVCTPLEADERVLSVSPNGDLWLGRDTDGTTTVRSVSPRGDETTFGTPWSIDKAQAFGPDNGVVVAAEGLFAVTAGTLDPLLWPDAVDAPTDFCGDPSVEGDGLVFAGDVFSRDIGQWWRWNVPGGPLLPDVAVAATSGACAGSDDETFLLRGTDVWSVRSEWVGPLPAFAPSVGVASDDAFGLASVVEGEVIVGEARGELERVQFEAGAALVVEAGPGALFIGTADHLYRLEDGSYAEIVDEAGSLGMTSLHADASGGIWVELEDQICHRRDTPALRVDGVRPYQRRRDAELAVTIGAGDADAVLDVRLDDVVVELVAVEPVAGEAGWGFTLPVETEGWHVLSVQADTRDGMTTRDIAFKVEKLVAATWQDDIAPLFDKHCGSAECHGPAPSDTARPDLSEYTAWAQRFESIRDRVGMTSDMPPLGAGDGSWGVDEVLLVLGWIDAGLPRGD